MYVMAQYIPDLGTLMGSDDEWTICMGHGLAGTIAVLAITFGPGSTAGTPNYNWEILQSDDGGVQDVIEKGVGVVLPEEKTALFGLNAAVAFFMQPLYLHLTRTSGANTDIGYCTVSMVIYEE